MPQYILDDTGEPIEEPDHVKWVDWCKGKWNGVMAQTLFPDGYVSTIFLMSAAEPEDGQAPILFETMIFEGPFAWSLWRYSSRRAAITHHNQVVAALREGKPPPDPD